jgi:hypothetical protein
MYIVAKKGKTMEIQKRLNRREEQKKQYKKWHIKKMAHTAKH